MSACRLSENTLSHTCTHTQVVLEDTSTLLYQPSIIKSSTTSHNKKGTSDTTTKVSDGSDQNSYKWAVAGMVLTVCSSYFATAFNIGDDANLAGGSLNGNTWFVQMFINAFSLSCFVTYEDKMAFVSCTAYVVYCCLHIMVSQIFYNLQT